MRKTALITAAVIAALAVPFTAAADYQSYPGLEGFSTATDYQKHIAKGIMAGEYFGDFDGNGVFDYVDSTLLLKYYADQMMPFEINWEGRYTSTLISNEFNNYIVKNYSDHIYDDYGEAELSIPLDNTMLENVRKYGDVDGNGTVDAMDASLLTGAFFWCFEPGDVNNDHCIDAADASLVLQYYAYISTGSKLDDFNYTSMKLLGDINGDSKTDAADASAILSLYAENSTKLVRN